MTKYATVQACFEHLFNTTYDSKRGQTDELF
jgi:hypothetical protein